jgi:hypothetical protein
MADEYLACIACGKPVAQPVHVSTTPTRMRAIDKLHGYDWRMCSKIILVVELVGKSALFEQPRTPCCARKSCYEQRTHGIVSAYIVPCRCCNNILSLCLHRTFDVMEVFIKIRIIYGWHSHFGHLSVLGGQV